MSKKEIYHKQLGDEVMGIDIRNYITNFGLIKGIYWYIRHKTRRKDNE